MLPLETIRSSIEKRLFSGRSAGAPASWISASGGVSGASVWRVGMEPEQGPRGPEFAVRRHEPDSDPGRQAWILNTLQAAESSGLAFVAAPIVGRDGADWPFVDAEGGRWEAAPWKPGRALSESPDDATAVPAAVTGLARFHRAIEGSPGGPSAGRSVIAERVARIDCVRVAAIDVPKSVHETWPELDLVLRSLPAAARRSAVMLSGCLGREFDLQPVHGDARPEHFLLTQGELTGLVDFGAMRRDSVLADVARLAGELALGDAALRDRVAAAYEEASGRPTDRAAVAALDLSGAVLAACNWARWLAEPGGSERDPRQVRARLVAIARRLLSE